MDTKSEDAGSRLELWFVAGVMLVTVVGTFVFGERYPFSVAPMFCEQPTCYCEYEVRDPKGELLNSRDFLLHRVYDGNPTGMGVGLKPPPVLDEFGKVPTEEEIVRHVQNQFKGKPSQLDFVVVTQKVIGDIGGKTVGELKDRTKTIKIVREIHQGAGNE